MYPSMYPSILPFTESKFLASPFGETGKKTPESYQALGLKLYAGGVAKSWWNSLATNGTRTHVLLHKKKR